MMGAAPEPPPEAERVFGEQLGLARRYADLLATTGISHGLVGPREAPRLWERHLVNCAVMHTLLPEDSAIADIGSGAGLPGLVLAIRRPDLEIHLVEPLLRRTTWLASTVNDLGLENVTIHRGRAEEVTLEVPAVTARAVASLDKLVSWSFPLLTPGGRLLALKGEAAGQELQAAGQLLQRYGVTRAELHVIGEGEISEPVRVVDVERPQGWSPSSSRGSGRARSRSSKKSRGSGSRS